jgi:predicted GNAT family acetyltransferase
VQVVQVPDAAEWLRRAEPLLLADEARHNLILGLAGTLRDQPGLYPEHELWVVEENAVVAAAALRTPPNRLVLAGGDRAALDTLADALEGLPGVVAAVPEAHEFAAAWNAKTGAEIRPGHAQGVYQLQRVVPPRPASGASRPASDGDVELLLEWLRGFSIEALHEEEPERVHLERFITQRLGSQSDSGFVLWEDGGEAVSATGFGSSTPNGSRIGPVYTPRERRGWGYASALVAEVSQARLDAGKRFCFLYTDLANPTSNKIYVDLGYQRVCESAELDFVLEPRL